MYGLSLIIIFRNRDFNFKWDQNVAKTHQSLHATQWPKPVSIHSAAEISTQNAPKLAVWAQKSKNFLGRGHSSVGRGTPLPTPYLSRRLSWVLVLTLTNPVDNLTPVQWLGGRSKIQTGYRGRSLPVIWWLKIFFILTTGHRLLLNRPTHRPSFLYVSKSDTDVWCPLHWPYSIRSRNYQEATPYVE